MRDAILGTALVSSIPIFIANQIAITTSLTPLFCELITNKVFNLYQPIANEEDITLMSTISKCLKRVTSCRINFLYYQAFNKPFRIVLESYGISEIAARNASRSILSSLGNLLVASTLTKEPEPSAICQFAANLLGNYIKYSSTPEISPKGLFGNDLNALSSVIIAGACGGLCVYLVNSLIKKDFNKYKLIKEMTTGSISYITYNVFYHEGVPQEQKIYAFMLTKGLDEIYKVAAGVSLNRFIQKDHNSAMNQIS
jgi:hypothetical protein